MHLARMFIAHCPAPAISRHLELRTFAATAPRSEGQRAYYAQFCVLGAAVLGRGGQVECWSTHHFLPQLSL